MASEHFDQQRLRDLENNLARQQELLKQFEEALSYATDPRIVGKYQKDIEQQKQTIAKYQQEYDSLKKNLTNATSAPKLVESIDNNQKEYEQLKTKLAAEPTAENINHTKNNTLEKQIFISYAWGDESEEIANRVDEAFQERGITIVRDKRDAPFKANIKEFMERIGQGKCVITIISEKYLKSPNCMFELVEIAKNGNFYDRIFPIVLGDAKIYQPVPRLRYIKHWEDQIQELDTALKEVSAANLQGFREDIDLYTEIRNTIAELTNTLRQMNVLTPELHTSSGFEQLYQAIENKLNQTSEETSVPK